METIKSNKYRKLSENNEITNSVLAVMQGRIRFFSQR